MIWDELIFLFPFSHRLTNAAETPILDAASPSVIPRVARTYFNRSPIVIFMAFHPFSSSLYRTGDRFYIHGAGLDGKSFFDRNKRKFPTPTSPFVSE